MFKKYIFLIFPILLFGGLNESGDFQVWNANSIDIKVGKKTNLTMESQFRYGRGGNKLYYKHYQGGLHFIRSPFIQILTAYRQIYHRRNGKWVVEYTPFIDLSLCAKTRGGWIIGDRNRIQYRILGKHFESHNRWVYRNRLEIIPSLRLGQSRIAPFLADEIFWEETRGISQNRLELGFHIPYRQKTQLDLSYIYRSLKNAKKAWIYHNVLRIQFSLHF